MGTAVADTGPLNYLILIEQISVLPLLFDVVTIPRSVEAELSRAKTPVAVKAWIASRPSWLRVDQSTASAISVAGSLDDGEKDAIMLAKAVGSDLVLIDERAGVAIARGMGLAVTGTLGLLVLAARRDLLDLKDAFDRLQATSFHCRPELIDDLLAIHRTHDRGL